ncbi:hypothetical protein DFH06DRAFT_1146969 [Mycena polygramma]|nr:hypothetical protein DFH06DRAFT_1146969 [Mycena polygramma]
MSSALLHRISAHLQSGGGLMALKGRWENGRSESLGFPPLRFTDRVSIVESKFNGTGTRGNPSLGDSSARSIMLSVPGDALLEFSSAVSRVKRWKQHRTAGDGCLGSLTRHESGDEGMWNLGDRAKMERKYREEKRRIRGSHANHGPWMDADLTQTTGKRNSGRRLQVIKLQAHDRGVEAVRNFGRPERTATKNGRGHRSREQVDQEWECGPVLSINVNDTRSPPHPPLSS